MPRSPVYVETYPKRNEDIERTIKRFMKKVKKERIIEQVRERSYYTKPSDLKKLRRKRTT